MKRCPACGETKPDDEFPWYKGKIYPWCKKCKNAKSLAAYHANKAVYRLRMWRSELKNKYGMTVEQFSDMVLDQQGRCAICGNAPCAPGLLVDQALDGGIRGLVCRRCRHGIQFLGHDPQRVRAAATYLRASRTQDDPMGDSYDQPA